MRVVCHRYIAGGTRLYTAKKWTFDSQCARVAFANGHIGSCSAESLQLILAHGGTILLYRNPAEAEARNGRMPRQIINASAIHDIEFEDDDTSYSGGGDDNDDSR